VVLQERERGGEDFLDHALDRGAVDLLARGVDGAEAALGLGGFFLLKGQDFEFGVDHLDARAAALGLAVDADADAGHDLLVQEHHVEPDDVEAAGVVHEDCFEAGARAADGADGDDLAAGGAENGGLQLVDRRFSRCVHMHREVGDEAADVGETEGGEESASARGRRRFRRGVVREMPGLRGKEVTR
jgi:hypothetical protein